MQCGKCEGQFQPVQVGDIEVDKCDQCSGIWFDLGELEKVLESKSIDSVKNQIENNQGHDERKASCPVCGGKGNMVQVTSLKNSAVHIDTCSVCYGQWLDGGEIEQLNETGLIDKIKSLF